MHILRWLLTHPIIFAWVLAILAILLNYGVGGGSKDEHMADAGHAVEQQADGAQDEHAKMEHDADGDKDEQQAEQAAAESDTSAANQTQQVADAGEATVQSLMGDAAVATEQAAEGAADATTEVVAAAGAAVAAVAVAATDAVAGEQATSAEQATAAAESEQASTEQAADTTAAAEQAADTTATAEQAAPAESSVEDLLTAAREAYWSDDFDRSAEFYLTLLEQEDMPSHKGELANVYWKQGKSTEAVELYVAIAPWMKEQGRLAELQNMKVYADMVDAAQGEAIGAILSQ